MPRQRIVPLLLAMLACAARLAAQDKPLLTAKDFGKWESAVGARVSPNGEWFAYALNRVSEENELRLRGGPRDTTLVVLYGLQPVFAADSRWVAFLIGVAPKERDRLLKEKKTVRTSFGARNLASGDTVSVPDASAFAFSADGRFIAVTRYPAEGKKVQDVLVLDLVEGTRLVFSNVAERAWAERRPLLALTAMVEGGAGNSVQLFDGSRGAVQVLASSTDIFRALAWRSKSEDLAVLRTVVTKEYADTAHAIVVWTGVGTPGVVMRTLEATSASVPSDLRIADARRPSWSGDGGQLFIGLRAREPVATAPKKSEEKISDVEIWHPKDVHVIPEQRASEQNDLRSTLLASWRLGETKVVRLASDAAERVTVLEGDRWATETDRKPYPFGQMFGRPYEDVWLVNVSTGTRKKALEKVRFFFGADPKGQRLAWFDGKDYWTMDAASGARANLTQRFSKSNQADFADREDDHPSDLRSPIGTPVWSKDGSTLLVYGTYDVWALAADGSGGRRLTDGAKDGIQYRLVSFAPFGAPVAERALDLTRPVYLSMYGKRTKWSGYARLADAELHRLVYADAMYSVLVKADSTERYVFLRQRFDESPNLYAAGADLANPRPLTATNPFQRDYAWGKAELMNFSSSVGRPLQAILYYPANYDKAKQYPMIVYTYELLTAGFHRYIVPRENDYYNASVFTQNGYFVLMPDIVFRPREPGVAVLHAVEPAVRAVIARGLVDAGRIGHAGHSQGGYEAAYLATHSKLFATAVMGSGISDMFSFAGGMHWGSIAEFAHWETGQFRMEGPPWEDMGAMLRNSPLNKVHVMPAKSVLVEIGGDDQTVDMRQGVEFYNYARRAGKHVVMLLYPGEGHGLGKKENAVDYERRILQWFAHYLKGEPAAAWITDGQTWVDRKRLLEANK